MLMSLPLSNRKETLPRIRDSKSRVRVVNLFWITSQVTHCRGWNQTVTVDIAISYHLAWDTIIFPLSHNFRFHLYVYCDVSVVARDKRVRMNDATQIFAVRCLAAGQASHSTDRSNKDDIFFCQPFSTSIKLVFIPSYLIKLVYRVDVPQKFPGCRSDKSDGGRHHQ